jgi:osmotically-inducible protein OsmY
MENPHSARFCRNDGFRFEDETSNKGFAHEPAGEVRDAGLSPSEQPPLQEEQPALREKPPLLPEDPASRPTPEAEDGQSADQSQIVVDPAAVICPTCGTPNAPGARFCRKDGVPLSGATADAPAPSADVPDVVKATVADAPQASSAPAEQSIVPLEQPSRPAKKGLFIGLAAVVLLAGAATGGYFYWNNRPAELLLAATERAPGSSSTETRPQVGESQPTTSIGSPTAGPESRDAAPTDGSATPSSVERQSVDAVAIHRQLTQQLAKAGMSSVNVTADSEGRVSLDGSVSNQQQKDKAIQWAFATYGVERVDASDLRVVPTARSSEPVRERNTVASQSSVRVPNAAAPTALDPARLEGEINRALRNGGLGGVTAQVADNLTVILKGSVASASQKERAFQIARRFQGVAAMKDRVFVID